MQATHESSTSTSRLLQPPPGMRDTCHFARKAQCQAMRGTRHLPAKGGAKPCAIVCVLPPSAHQAASPAACLSEAQQQRCSGRRAQSARCTHARRALGHILAVTLARMGGAPPRGTLSLRLRVQPQSPAPWNRKASPRRRRQREAPRHLRETKCNNRTRGAGNIRRDQGKIRRDQGKIRENRQTVSDTMPAGSRVLTCHTCDTAIRATRAIRVHRSKRRSGRQSAHPQ